MLVHPDKNMGNEKAAEAFKKLQNAYEVILVISFDIFFFCLFSILIELLSHFAVYYFVGFT